MGPLVPTSNGEMAVRADPELEGVERAELADKEAKELGA